MNLTVKNIQDALVSLIPVVAVGIACTGIVAITLERHAAVEELKADIEESHVRAQKQLEETCNNVVNRYED